MRRRRHSGAIAPHVVNGWRHLAQEHPVRAKIVVRGHSPRRNLVVDRERDVVDHRWGTASRDRWRNVARNRRRNLVVLRVEQIRAPFTHRDRHWPTIARRDRRFLSDRFRDLLD